MEAQGVLTELMATPALRVRHLVGVIRASLWDLVLWAARVFFREDEEGESTGKHIAPICRFANVLFNLPRRTLEAAEGEGVPEGSGQETRANQQLKMAETALCFNSVAREIRPQEGAEAAMEVVKVAQGVRAIKAPEVFRGSKVTGGSGGAVQAEARGMA